MFIASLSFQNEHLVTFEYKPRYEWQETWPGEGHQDYSGWDGADIIGRLQIVIGGKMGGKWLWAAGPCEMDTQASHPTYGIRRYRAGGG